MPWLRRTAWLLALLLGGGLAGSLPRTVYLPHIPQVWQTYDNCGPASLSEVLAYYGITRSQGQIQALLRPTGGYMSDLVIPWYVQRFGLQATIFRGGTIAELERVLALGIPVIVLQWLDQPGQVAHFRVVRGYQQVQRRIWVSDPMFGNAAYLSYHNFLRLWTVSDDEFIPVYPPAWSGRLAGALGLKNS